MSERSYTSSQDETATKNIQPDGVNFEKAEREVVTSVVPCDHAQSEEGVQDSSSGWTEMPLG